MAYSMVSAAVKSGKLTVNIAISVQSLPHALDTCQIALHQERLEQAQEFPTGVGWTSLRFSHPMLQCKRSVGCWQLV